VYWANYGNGQSGYVAKAPSAGGAVTTVGTGVAPVAITHDGKCVYWIDVVTNAASVAPF
jgi:hypothetical protein